MCLLKPGENTSKGDSLRGLMKETESWWHLYLSEVRKESSFPPSKRNVPHLKEETVEQQIDLFLLFPTSVSKSHLPLPLPLWRTTWKVMAYGAFMSISEVRTYDVGNCKYDVFSVQVVLVGDITDTLGKMFLVFLCLLLFFCFQQRSNIAWSQLKWAIM